MLSSLPVLSEVKSRLGSKRTVSALMKELGEHVGGAAREPQNLVSRDCPVCPPGQGAPEAEPAIVGPVYAFHRCAGCGVLFAPRTLAPGATRKLYGERPIYKSYWDLMKADAEAMVGREVYGGLVQKLLGEVSGRDVAIDMGCGFGKLTAELAPHFDRTIGLELNRRTAQAGRALFGANIESKHLDKLDLAPGSVDLIVMNQVLEHLADVKSVVSTARKLLKPNGILWIGIPHGHSLGMRVLRGAHEFVATHLHVNMFTAASLRRLAEETGFQVAHLGTDDAVDLSAADWMMRRLDDVESRLYLVAPAMALDKLVRQVAAKVGLPSKLGVGAHLEATLVKREDA